jgi:hypothetical protein
MACGWIAGNRCFRPGWPADGLLEIAASVQDGLNTLADGPPAGYQPSKHWTSQIDLGSEIANECTSEGLKSSLHVLCTARALLPYRCYAVVEKRAQKWHEAASYRVSQRDRWSKPPPACSRSRLQKGPTPSKSILCRYSCIGVEACRVPVRATASMRRAYT